MPISESPTTSAAVGDPIVLREVHKRFGERKVLQGVSCRFPRGKISVVLGGSGSGKSTLLRLIGGLIRADRGSVLVDGEDVGAMSDRGLMSMRRKLGMLFQGGAMLDSYTVFENLALPLRETTKMSRGEIETTVAEALQAVGVTGADQLLPGQLSGGMLRRVALARAMIRKPGILLVDEPFSGLDPISLRKIEKLLMEINRRFDISMVVVSHDIPSTMRMADHVVLLLEGKVYEGAPRELQRSEEADVAEFLNVGLDVEAK